MEVQNAFSVSRDVHTLVECSGNNKSEGGGGVLYELLGGSCATGTTGSFCLSMLIAHPFSQWLDADPYQFPPFYGNRSDIS